jgi:hypothetical protein
MKYIRLKKSVELQAKEQKCSFNAVQSSEALEYRIAFTQWMEEKSSFRDRRETEPQEDEAKASSPSAEAKSSAGSGVVPTLESPGSGPPGLVG